MPRRARRPALFRATISLLVRGRRGFGPPGGHAVGDRRELAVARLVPCSLPARATSVGDLTPVVSVMPWVVTLGQPIRMPDGRSGGAGRTGWSSCSGDRARRSGPPPRPGHPDRAQDPATPGGCRCGRRRDTCTWPARRVGYHLGGSRLVRGAREISLSATALAATACICGPPGRTSLVRSPWCAPRGTGSCRRAGRAAPLWVVGTPVGWEGDGWLAGDQAMKCAASHHQDRAHLSGSPGRPEVDQSR